MFKEGDGMYYLMLTVGILLTLLAAFYAFQMVNHKTYDLLTILRAGIALVFGVFLLAITIPSLKHMLLKEYDLVKGKCTIEITSSRRHAESTFEMLETGNRYSFNSIPSLDAYGKKIPYYCELTVTKDHKFEVGYKVYDVDSKELILSSD